MAELDLNKLREFAVQHGYWPGSADDAHLEVLAEQNVRIELSWRELRGSFSDVATVSLRSEHALPE